MIRPTGPTPPIAAISARATTWMSCWPTRWRTAIPAWWTAPTPMIWVTTGPVRMPRRERGVRSPLQEVGLTKAEIRALARPGLPNWDKPAAACLASRIPYGTPVTAEALAQIEAAEEHLHRMGFRQVRVRRRGTVARLEVEPGRIGACSRAARGNRRRAAGGWLHLCDARPGRFSVGQHEPDADRQMNRR